MKYRIQQWILSRQILNVQETLRCWKSLVIRKFHVKVTLIIYVTPLVMASTHCHVRCWLRGTLPHYWWDYKLVQLFWKSIWQFHQVFRILLPQYPAMLLLGIYLEDVPLYNRDTFSTMFISSIIHNSQKVEKTEYYSDIKIKDTIKFCK